MKTNTVFEKQLKFNHYIGIILFSAGLMILLDCIIRFAMKGKGTLSPLDPVKKLVISGLYNYSRNPMYVGVMMMLIGEAIFFQSTQLLIYLIIIFLIFNLFIILVEEPWLKENFGEQYRSYCKKARRWL